MSWKACAHVKELRVGLGITEKFVLLMLAEYHRTDGKNEWPSTETLAGDCLMTERGVRQILNRLIKGGFLEREKGGGRGNMSRYFIVGLDCKKRELHSGNTNSLNPETGNQTGNHGAVNREYSGTPNKVLPVLETYGGETPPDLHPIQYATKLLQDLVMAHNRSNLDAVESAVSLEISQGKSGSAAYDFIKARALDARGRGQAMDKFYFVDWGKHRATRAAVRMANPADEARRQLAEQRSHAD